MPSTVDAICEAALLPISIILVAVGDQNEGTAKQFRVLDADFDEAAGEKSKLVHSKTGERCSRDVVQYVPFRKYRKDFKNLARELLAEIAKQIKEYFLSKNIYPNPMRMQLRGNRLKSECTQLKSGKHGEIITVF